jgi:hypothetical protein
MLLDGDCRVCCLSLRAIVTASIPEAFHHAASKPPWLIGERSFRNQATQSASPCRFGSTRPILAGISLPDAASRCINRKDVHGAGFRS